VLGPHARDCSVSVAANNANASRVTLRIAA
jgi:hypothetical protein